MAGTKSITKKSAPKTKVATKSTAPQKKVQPASKKAVSKSEAKASASKSASKSPKKTSGSSKKPTPKAAPKGGAVEAHGKNSNTHAQADQPPVKISARQAAFFKKQRERLLALKDTLLDSMNGVARDSLRSRAEGNEASAFGMHQADAGSDAYDRDFALSLLSQEQDSLYEIDEALKRIDQGVYGVCEISQKPIPHPRLEALPFTRYTVECQADLEKRNRFMKVRKPTTSLFGLGDDDGDDDSDDSADSKD